MLFFVLFYWKMEFNALNDLTVLEEPGGCECHFGPTEPQPGHADQPGVWKTPEAGACSWTLQVCPSLKHTHSHIHTHLPSLSPFHALISISLSHLSTCPIKWVHYCHIFVPLQICDWATWRWQLCVMLCGAPRNLPSQPCHGAHWRGSGLHDKVQNHLFKGPGHTQSQYQHQMAEGGYSPWCSPRFKDLKSLHKNERDEVCVWLRRPVFWKCFG